MPAASGRHLAVNGVTLWVEEAGPDDAPALVFVHEFGGDTDAWRGQVGHFRKDYRCVAYNARGYPPSDVPEDEEAYGQDIATADLGGVMDALGIGRAHIVGLSMGAYTGLRFAMAHPDRVISLAAASGGSGGHPPTREAFIRDTLALSDHILKTGSMDLPGFIAGPARVQLRKKAPEVWRDFADSFRGHSATGSGLTLRRVQAARPSLHDFADELAALAVPVLLMLGDEDEPCLDINLFLKRIMPTAGLVTFPKAGHLINLEDPAGFNAAIEAFHAAVVEGSWTPRDPAARPGSAYLSDEAD